MFCVWPLLERNQQKIAAAIYMYTTKELQSLGCSKKSLGWLVTHCFELGSQYSKPTFSPKQCWSSGPTLHESTSTLYWGWGGGGEQRVYMLAKVQDVPRLLTRIVHCMLRFLPLKKFGGLSFLSILLTICVFLSFPSLTILVPSWFIIISLLFFYLSKLLLSGFL